MLSNQWLQNKSFIQWRLFPSEEDNLYWEKFIQDNPHFQNEIEEAIRILKSIKLNTQKLSPVVANEDKAAIETEIKNLLEILTDRQKEAVYLRFIQELEYEEVANLLDMTAPAVRKLISRAIKRMRDEKF